MLVHILVGVAGVAAAGAVGHFTGKATAKGKYDAIRSWASKGGTLAPHQLAELGTLFNGTGQAPTAGHGGFSGFIPPSVPIVGGKPFTVDASGVTVGNYHASIPELGLDLLTGGAVSATGYGLSNVKDIPVVGDVLSLL